MKMFLILIQSAEHLAEDATSKPVYGFQCFWRDRASSIYPQSEDTNYRPKFVVFGLAIEPSSNVEERSMPTTLNEDFPQEASSTVFKFLYYFTTF